MPYIDPDNSKKWLLTDGAKYKKLVKQCHEYIYFDILSQTDIAKFKYPKKSPMLGFLTAVYFLRLNHKDVCHPFKNTKSLNQVSFVIDNDKITAPKNDWETAVNNCRKRFVLLLLIIREKNTPEIANLLLYDRKYARLERFVPFGATQMQLTDSKRYDEMLLKLFNNSKVELKTYYQPYIGCPMKLSNTDVIDKNVTRGIICAVWGVWFINLKLKYPEIWREVLVNTAKEHIIKHKVEFNRFVENYLKFLLKHSRTIRKKFSNKTMIKLLSQKYR